MANYLNTVQLTEMDSIPPGLLETSPERIHDLLQGPTLIHLAGKHQSPLFVSVLLHGNEPVGLQAVQNLLKKYQQQNLNLPRSLSILIGNTLAASQGKRRLDVQPDYNRIWPGTELPVSPETMMAENVVNIMQQKNIFASIDIHNNTGLNPHYACINKLENDFLQLASLFGRMVVYFVRPKGVQSAAFAKICPAVTLECGRPGQLQGVEHAMEFINSCLHLSEFPNHAPKAQDLDLYHTVAQVKVDESISFGFQQDGADLLLDKEIECMNFNEIPAGTILGKVNGNIKSIPLLAIDENGQNVSNNFFKLCDNELQINRRTMPSMLTLDEKIIKQDCLCYLMERIHP